MNSVFIAADNIISSLGFTTEENFANITENITGILYNEDRKISRVPVFISTVNNNILEEKFGRIAEPENFTRLEKLMILSAKEALEQTSIKAKYEKTIFIFSTTKGNIDLLDNTHQCRFEADRKYLWYTAGLITDFFGNKNKPLVISTACTSGVTALIYAQRLLRKNKFENAVVIGADIVSEFVVSGFQAFQAISPMPCKPFDEKREGISLGEGCGTVILTKNKNNLTDSSQIKITAGATSNDANHISGPSRTGEGLKLAISKTMNEAGIDIGSIDFISAHGTGTIFNDDMESLAFSGAGLGEIPLNSLKGYFGHTLGAAGVIESIVSVQSQRKNILIKSLGCDKPGTAATVNMILKNEKKELRTCLKTASGFGGFNASVIFSKGNRHD